MGDILIFSGSTGGGHNQVAATLKAELEAKGHTVHVSDLLAEYNGFVKFCCIDIYRIMYKKFGKVYGFLYHQTNTKFNSKITTRIFSGLLKKPLLKRISEISPDLIITVHPFGTGILGQFRRKGLLQCKTIALITDFAAHWTHVGEGIDRYIVASDFLKNSLVRKGVSPHIIRSAGIPIRKDFQHKNTDIRDDGIFHVLIMGGSDGESFIEKSIYWIAKNPDIHITIVCGNNQLLKNKLEKNYRNQKHIQVLGFVKEIKPLMSKADLIVTKPGAITITEALSQELPIIIPYVIPGHESANAKFLVKAGVAQRTRSSMFLAYVIEKMVTDPSIIDSMRENIKVEGVRHSTHDIIESIAECI